MSALDFPTSPNDGDTYEGYVYNATKGVWQWQTLTPSLVSLTDTTISSPASGEVLEYDGANWVNAAAAVGGLVAVKSALKTDRESFGSVAAGDDRAVSDLSITHEVSDPANRLIISAFFGVANTGRGFGNVGIAVNDGAGFLAIGDASGSATRVTAGARIDSNGGNSIGNSLSVTYVHTPGSGSKTYTVHALHLREISDTVIINGTGSTSSELNSRGASALVIQEVAV